MEDQMTKATTLDRPVTTTSETWAGISIAAAVAFLGVLLGLHFVKPELDPSWHFISEYAIGEYGWMMVLAFFASALSFVALFFAIRSYARCIPGRIGSALLLVSALGLIIGGIFPTDPITAGPGELTRNGAMHNVGGTLGIAIPFAVAFISRALFRNPAWSSSRGPVLFAAGLAWSGFLLALVMLQVLLAQSGGRFGPDVLVGWYSRFEMVAYSVWVIVVASQVDRLGRQQA